MGWSVRIALMACLTQNSGFKGGRKGSISFLNGEENTGDKLMTGPHFIHIIEATKKRKGLSICQETFYTISHLKTGKELSKF